MHILPDGFKRIRFYGIWAGGAGNPKLAAARRLLPEPLRLEAPEPAPAVVAPDSPAAPTCPHCGGRMQMTTRLLPERAPPTVMPLAIHGGRLHAA